MKVRRSIVFVSLVSCALIAFFAVRDDSIPIDMSVAGDAPFEEIQEALSPCSAQDESDKPRREEDPYFGSVPMVFAGIDSWWRIESFTRTNRNNSYESEPLLVRAVRVSGIEPGSDPVIRTSFDVLGDPQDLIEWGLQEANAVLLPARGTSPVRAVLLELEDGMLFVPGCDNRFINEDIRRLLPADLAQVGPLMTGEELSRYAQSKPSDNDLFHPNVLQPRNLPLDVAEGLQPVVLSFATSQHLEGTVCTGTGFGWVDCFLWDYPRVPNDRTVRLDTYVDESGVLEIRLHDRPGVEDVVREELESDGGVLLGLIQVPPSEVKTALAVCITPESANSASSDRLQVGEAQIFDGETMATIDC